MTTVGSVGRYLGQAFVYTTDIASFYPSISYLRIRALFERLVQP